MRSPSSFNMVRMRSISIVISLYVIYSPRYRPPKVFLNSVAVSPPLLAFSLLPPHPSGTPPPALSPTCTPPLPYYLQRGSIPSRDACPWGSKVGGRTAPLARTLTPTLTPTLSPSTTTGTTSRVVFAAAAATPAPVGRATPIINPDEILARLRAAPRPAQLPAAFFSSEVRYSIPFHLPRL